MEGNPPTLFLMTIKVSPHDGAETLGFDSSTWTGHTQQTGFYDVARLGFISLDWHLITAFVRDGDLRLIPSTYLKGRLTPGDTDIDGQRLHLTWLSQSFHTLAPDADEESIQRYTRAYILQLIGGFLFSGKSSDKVHLMFLSLLEDFEVAGRWRYEFQTTSISMHVLAQYRHHLDRLTTDQPYVDDMNVGLPDYCTVGKDIWCTILPLICFHIIEWHRPDRVLRHDVDWTTRHGDYIRRWSSRREHIARGEMTIGSLGYHDPYMVWYPSITIRFLTRTGSFHELLTTSIHQIYDIAPPDDFRIRRLCTTVLEAIHEMDRLDAPFSVDATTQLQPPSGDVRPTRRGPRTREIRHTPAVARVRPSTDISPPPHQQPTSSITRSGGVRTRGGGPHTRSSPPPHQQPISSITRSGGVRTRGGGPHTRSSPPLHQQPISPITRSGGVRTREEASYEEHTSVLRDAPSTDISLPPVQETSITPMEVPSTPPVVPLVASSPPSIEATLVHEELVHIANDNQQGQKTNRGRGHGRGRGRRRGRGTHGGLHVSPIEPIVEHAHHRRPLRKRKAPSCGTH
ncbi:Serine/threonine-protein phosphatase 7 long form-like [Vitis vinifera]|uniref:Serine/threonine-protein phosphatase 7 long form-like n=1 Tax=Vitis vinifera TaxID=29760 RepID=A0A438IDU9_VITVI|nr:Serine/threonine-protein phosphatase 7 long form-like [Vitis vinifera]